jgi:starch synthase
MVFLKNIFPFLRKYFSKGGMHVIHIASELAPIAKVGGLADVIYGLARATQKKGHTVEIIIPKYDSIDYSQLQNLKPEAREIWSYDGPNRVHNTVWSAEIEGLKVLLLEPHHPGYYFSRGAIYGFPDDIDRFVYFSRAVLEYLFKSGKKPDILHLHDWPTALVAPLYREMYVPLGFRTKGIVLTIHNLQHQGKCSPQNVTRAGLRGEDFLTPEKMQDPILSSHLNLLKGGIVYSDFITTVSPTYEKEIKTQEGGFGLEKLLTQHQNKLKGILNGIDYDYWNPATDPLIPAKYSINDAEKGKKANKAAFLKKFGMKESKGPLICAISRLVPQKGPALIIYALKQTIEKGGQFVLLGTAPDPVIDGAFKNLQKELAPNKDVVIHLEYDEKLAHLTYAASDMIMIPSLFEPCGLTQMIALRYGTIPIVRKTGGLADTVIDIDLSKESNGFVFDFPDTSGIEWVLNRACDFYKKEKRAKLIERGMKSDFSWDRSADEYLSIYDKISSSQK